MTTITIVCQGLHPDTIERHTITEDAPPSVLAARVLRDGVIVAEPGHLVTRPGDMTPSFYRLSRQVELSMLGGLSRAVASFPSGAYIAGTAIPAVQHRIIAPSCILEVTWEEVTG